MVNAALLNFRPHWMTLVFYIYLNLACNWIGILDSTASPHPQLLTICTLVMLLDLFIILVTQVAYLVGRVFHQLTLA